MPTWPRPTTRAIASTIQPRISGARFRSGEELSRVFQGVVEPRYRLALLHHVLVLEDVEVVAVRRWDERAVEPARGVHVRATRRGTVDGAVDSQAFFGSDPVRIEFRGVWMRRLVPQRDDAVATSHDGL